jgi:endonuclease IV
MKKTMSCIALLIFTTFCLFSCNKNELIIQNTQNIQVKQESPIERLRKETYYDLFEEQLQRKIMIHTVYARTPDAKANPDKLEKSLNELLDEVKKRYSLTDQQINLIHLNKLYIGMPRTCVYLAWSIYDDLYQETKTVTTNGTTHTIIFEEYRGKYKTAITENDALVSYQE